MTTFATGRCWSLRIDPDYPVAIVAVSDAPTGPDAKAMGEAFVRYAKSIDLRPWAMLSDLRNMTVATADGQQQWADNMTLLLGLGMRRWAVLNSQPFGALQAAVVAADAQLKGITVVTFDEAEALAWARSVAG